MPTIPSEVWRDGQLVTTGTVNVPQESVNADTVADQLAQAMATLSTTYTRADQIATATSFTAAQRDQAIKDCAAGIRLLARQMRRLIRHMAGDYSGTD